MLGRRGSALVMLIVLIASFTVSLNTNAQSNDAKEVADAATTLIKASFPEVWGLISNTTPKTRYAQAGEYGEALAGFPTYVVEWSASDADVSVLVALVDGAAIPIGVEATIKEQVSEGSGKLVYGLSNKVLSEVKALYNELAREAMRDGNVEIIGFQIYVNGTPVAFIDPTKPSIVPATLSWNVYFVKPILAFTVLDDYPLVKAAITHAGKNAFTFKVSVDEARAILSKEELRNVSRISKYVLIANKTARPAYVVTLGPWNTAVIYADNGEFLSSLAPATQTTSSMPASPAPFPARSNPWNLPIPPQYFPYFLSGVAMAVTALIGIVVIRTVTRGERESR